MRQGRRSERQERRKVTLGLIDGADVADHDPGELGDTIGGVEERRVRREVVGRRGGQLAIELQDLACRRERVCDEAAVDGRTNRTDPVFEGSNDPEVAATTAERPEQVGVLVLARAEDPAVGRHDVGREQVVEGKAVAGHDPAEAATEGQAQMPVVEMTPPVTASP